MLLNRLKVPRKNNVFIKMCNVKEYLLKIRTTLKVLNIYFFIAGRAGKVDRSSFHQIEIQEGNACEGEHLSVTDLVITHFIVFFCNKSISKFSSRKI